MTQHRSLETVVDTKAFCWHPNTRVRLSKLTKKQAQGLGWEFREATWPTGREPNMALCWPGPDGWYQNIYATKPGVIFCCPIHLVARLNPAIVARRRREALKDVLKKIARYEGIGDYYDI